MKGLIYLFICFWSVIYAESISHLLEENFLKKYTRPITILYISETPDFLHVPDGNVLVVWSKNATLLAYLKARNIKNYVVLSGPITAENMMSLSECEHFDVAIIEISMDLKKYKGIHLADNTMYILPKNIGFGSGVIGEINKKYAYISTHVKTILKKNWWKSCSWHKDYPIISNYHEKYLIKPKAFIGHKGEEVDGAEDKKYRWAPGINLYTFTNLNGIYPSKEFIRKKILENFNPFICNDFGIANIILQGKRLRIIDFDSNYGDPYGRLKMAITVQMNMKYD